MWAQAQSQFAVPSTFSGSLLAPSVSSPLAPSAACPAAGTQGRYWATHPPPTLHIPVLSLAYRPQLIPARSSWPNSNVFSPVSLH